jgi:hypothetical protein
VIQKFSNPSNIPIFKESNEEENLIYKVLDILLHLVIQEESLIFGIWIVSVIVRKNSHEHKSNSE